MFEAVIGRSTGWRKCEYTWRDMALYALAVGADADDLLYTWEHNMKVVPSAGVLPYWNAVNTQPQQPVPCPGVILAIEPMSKEIGFQLINNFHMGHELILYRPFDAIKGSMVSEDKITKIYDRGPGKGAIIETEMPVYDEAGNLVCLNRSTTLMSSDTPGKEFGGFGGPSYQKPMVEYPEGPPDVIADAYVSKTQNLLYRLTGDTNLGHVDKEFAKRYDPNGVFMQGLCSFGFGCLMLCKSILPGEPERMRRMSVQLRAVCYPGTRVQLRAWKVGEHKVSFRLVDMDRSRHILDNCEFEWK